MKKQTLKSAKEKARKAFKAYIRLRDALSTTGTIYNCVCCTCGKLTRLDGSLHAGHFTQGSHGSTYFEETNVNGQCSTCNHFLHAALDKYLVFMIRKYGQPEVDRLYSLNGQIKKYTVSDYEQITQKYKEKLETLLKI